MMPKKSLAPKCCHCDGAVSLVRGADIYARPFHGKEDLFYWKCECGAYIGCHRGGSGQRPLGRPANAELRKARALLHDRVDPLWNNAAQYYDTPPNVGEEWKLKSVARKRVYAYLADKLDLDEKDCHIGIFDLTTCRRAWIATRGVTYTEIRAWAKERFPVRDGVIRAAESVV